MRISRIELENWKGIQKAAIDIGQGINLLSGRNEIGKSTIIEAVRLSILGDTKSDKKDLYNFVPWGTSVKAAVKLTFLTGAGREYRIEKSFPKGIANFYENGRIVSDDMKKTRENIFRTLNINENLESIFNLLIIEQGKALNIITEPDKIIGPDFRNFIGDSITETLMQNIQRLENVLNEEYKKIFTDGGVLIKGQKASEFYKALQDEESLRNFIEKLKSEKMLLDDKIEQLKKIDEKLYDIKKEEEDLKNKIEQYRKKERALIEFEREKLIYQQIEEKYRDYKRTDNEIEIIRDQELPKWEGFRKSLLDISGIKIEEANRDKKAYELELEQLKNKKAVLDQLQNEKKDFELMKEKLQDLENIRKEKAIIRDNLPELLLQNRYSNRKQAEDIIKKLENNTKMSENIDCLQKKLLERKDIIKKDVDSAKILEKDINSIKTRLEAFKSRLNLSLSITSLENKELDFKIKKDEDDYRNYHIDKPADFKDFSKISLQYNDDFMLDFQGELTGADIKGQQNLLKDKNRELNNVLEKYGTDSFENLEKIYQEQEILKKEIVEMTKNLIQPGDIRKLNYDKIELDQFLKRNIDEEISKIPELKDRILTYRPEMDLPGARDSLIKLTGERDHLKDQEKKLLQNETYDDFIKHFDRIKQEIASREQNLSALEPESLTEVTQKDIDRKNEEIVRQANIINKLIDNKNLLEKTDTKCICMDNGGIPCPDELQVRDKINEFIIKLSTAEKHMKEEILKDITKEELINQRTDKTNLINTKAIEIKEMPPVYFSESKSLTNAIKNLETLLNLKVSEIRKSEKEKTILETEIKNSGSLDDEINEKEYAYRKLVDVIEDKYADLCSLKLLLRIIHEEKEKAESDVFRPVRDRMSQMFSKLVSDRYSLNIGNDLNLALSVKTIDNRELENIQDFVSFGTKEQLSFLFRLSIAETLSQAETQFMVLDDSFVNTDKFRMKELLKIMAQYKNRIQFLIFTCRPEDYNDFEGEINRVDLEKLIEK